MVNALAREFHTASLLRFALPTVLMNLFVGLYYIVDGVCVARFASTDALSAMNITYPTFFTALAISIMLATGGSAAAALTMLKEEGYKHFRFMCLVAAPEGARGDFSFLALLTFLVGLAFSIACLVFIRPLLYFLGASDVLYPMSRTYLGIQLCFTPAIFLQMFFQTFFVTAGKPKIGLLLSLCAGCTNIVLDLLLVGWLHLGVSGASLATCVGYSIPAVAGVVYFSRRRGTLYFVKPRCTCGGAAVMVLRKCWPIFPPRLPLRCSIS